MDPFAETAITRTTLVTPATTVTVTATPTPTSTPLETRATSTGRSWTTPAPYSSTQYDWRGASPTSQIAKSYYPVPKNTVVRTYCRSHTKEIVGAFFGGFGGGILVWALILLVVRLRRRRRRGAIQLRSPHSSVEDLLTTRSGAGGDQAPLLDHPGEMRQSGILNESNNVEAGTEISKYDGSEEV